MAAELIMKNAEWSGPPGPPRILKKWAPLVLGIMTIILFVVWVAPALGELSLIRTAVTAIREENIEAGAYFYTDVEKVGEAELYLRDSFRFSHEPVE
ncbi:MAG: hypothetical protein A2078_10725 [Nitrospirae bacterium GWC2_57_9]|nr:MAG: hypothetical protein A2078_10725 [Nitrospirae bacterium GWC2_57_9]